MQVLCPEQEVGVLSTLLGGGIALAVAIGFLSVVLAKVPSVPLWIVVLIGIAMMIASLFEAVRSGEEQFGTTDQTKLPAGDQQKRAGIS